MATVELDFAPLPGHVRTARLIAVAVARRAGIGAGILDEVRLSVGEACARAVGLHQQHGLDAPVQVRLSDDHGRLEVTVIDAGPPGAELPPDDEGPADLLTTGTIRLPDTATDASPEVLPSGYNLAVIAGLVEDLDVEPGEDGSGGTRVTMRWPTGADGSLPAAGAPAPPTPPGPAG